MSSGPRVVAGSVCWDDDWSGPVVMRRIGYGRRAKPEELPSFLIGAFFIYPKIFALTWPWNERIQASDDRFIGALWRSKGVSLLFEPQARAFHDAERSSYRPDQMDDHIYVNLFDALIANPDIMRALCYETIGFLAGAKLYFRHPTTALQYIGAWSRGNYRFIRDWRFLKACYINRDLPSDREQHE